MCIFLFMSLFYVLICLSFTMLRYILFNTYSWSVIYVCEYVNIFMFCRRFTNKTMSPLSSFFYSICNFLKCARRSRAQCHLWCVYSRMNLIIFALWDTSTTNSGKKLSKLSKEISNIIIDDYFSFFFYKGKKYTLLIFQLWLEYIKVLYYILFCHLCSGEMMIVLRVIMSSRRIQKTKRETARELDPRRQTTIPQITRRSWFSFSIDDLPIWQTFTVLISLY